MIDRFLLHSFSAPLENTWNLAEDKNKNNKHLSTVYTNFSLEKVKIPLSDKKNDDAKSI